LRALDPLYEKLADRVEKRWLSSAKFLILQQSSERLGIRSPYNSEFVDFARERQMRFLSNPIKAWLFPAEDLPDVLDEVSHIYGPQNVLTTDLRPVKTLMTPKFPKSPEAPRTAETPDTRDQPGAATSKVIRL
jgi:hypothetical protein